MARTRPQSVDARARDGPLREAGAARRLPLARGVQARGDRRDDMLLEPGHVGRRSRRRAGRLVAGGRAKAVGAGRAQVIALDLLEMAPMPGRHGHSRRLSRGGRAGRLERRSPGGPSIL